MVDICQRWTGRILIEKDKGVAFHGPYARWTRKIDNKAVTGNSSEDEPYFEDARRLRTLISKL